VTIQERNAFIARTLVVLAGALANPRYEKAEAILTALLAEWGYDARPVFENAKLSFTS
jgi:hypothetical protein